MRLWLILTSLRREAVRAPSCEFDLALTLRLCFRRSLALRIAGPGALVQKDHCVLFSYYD